MPISSWTHITVSLCRADCELSADRRMPMG